MTHTQVICHIIIPGTMQTRHSVISVQGCIYIHRTAGI